MSPDIDELHRRFEAMFPPEEPPVQAVPEATPAEGEAPPAPPAPEPVIPCRRTEHAMVGYDLDISVAPDHVIGAAKVLDEAGFAIDMVSAVDWPEDNQFEVVYDFLHFHGSLRVVVRTRISREEPEIASLSAVYPGANWHERETAEFFGIRFTGHPNLINLLLPENFEGFPLRKDYKPDADPLLQP